MLRIWAARGLGIPTGCTTYHYFFLFPCSCTFKSAELIRTELKHCKKTATVGVDLAVVGVSSPERCPVCEKHIAAHGGVLMSNMYKLELLKYTLPCKTFY